MKFGVFGTSLKENERRLPIHSDDIHRIPEQIRALMFFETGYGKSLGLNDQRLASQSAGTLARDDLFAVCDLLLIPRSMPLDLQQMRPHQVLCGWLHCVQQVEMAQAAIERCLTCIAWEAMHAWSPSGERQKHVFYKNNEIAGYAAVLHALQLRAIDGFYGPRRKVVVLSYGSVSRGAIYALQGRGFDNIHVFSRRPPHQIPDRNPDVGFGQYYEDASGQMVAVTAEGKHRPLIDELAEADLICNGILQDPQHPLLFVREEEVGRLKPNGLIIDVSCDRGMGFSFARPTSFNDPVFLVGENIMYYSVDHTPSYLWDAASREISLSLLPLLPALAHGPDVWVEDPILSRAIEIQDGIVYNPQILGFQHRALNYPYPFLKPQLPEVLERRSRFGEDSYNTWCHLQ